MSEINPNIPSIDDEKKIILPYVDNNVQITQPTGHTQKDSVQGSEEEVEGKNAAPPENPEIDKQVSAKAIDPEAFVFMINEINNAAINAITSNMVETARELAEMQKLDAKETEEKLQLLKQNIRRGLEDFYDAASVNIGEGSRSSAVASMWMLSNISFPTSGIPGESSNLSAITEALKQFVPEEARGLVGSLGDSMMVGTFVPAMAGVINETIEKQGRIADQNFFIAYRDQVLQLVEKGAFTNLIGSVLGSHGLELADSLMAKMNLVYLFAALSIFYKEETGWLTPEEVMGMVKGDITLPKEDPRNPIILEIYNQLSRLHADDKVEFLERIQELLHENPSIEDLKRPYHLLKKMWMDDKVQHILNYRVD